MKKAVFLLVFISAFVGAIAVDIAAYYEDQSLRANKTTECKAFSQIEVPSSGFIPRRFKQEDSGAFYQHRANCELSLQ